MIIKQILQKEQVKIHNLYKILYNYKNQRNNQNGNMIINKKKHQKSNDILNIQKKLIKYLKIDSHLRSKEQIKVISDFFIKPLNLQWKNEQEIENIGKNFKLIIFEKNSNISLPNIHLYYIIQGQIQLIINDLIKIFNEGEIVYLFSNFDNFKAQCISNICQLAAIEDQYIQNENSKNISLKNYTFINDKLQDLLEICDDEKIKFICNYFNQQECHKNQIIFQEGEKLSNIFLIQDGEFQIMKKYLNINDKNVSQSQHKTKYFIDNYFNANKFYSQFCVSTLIKGYFCGEEDAMLNNTVHSYSLKCISGKGTIWNIQLQQFIQFIDFLDKKKLLYSKAHQKLMRYQKQYQTEFESKYFIKETFKNLRLDQRNDKILLPYLNNSNDSKQELKNQDYFHISSSRKTNYNTLFDQNSKSFNSVKDNSVQQNNLKQKIFQISRKVNLKLPQKEQSFEQIKNNIKSLTERESQLIHEEIYINEFEKYDNDNTKEEQWGIKNKLETLNKFRQLNNKEQNFQKQCNDYRQKLKQGLQVNAYGSMNLNFIALQQIKNEGRQKEIISSRNRQILDLKMKQKREIVKTQRFLEQIGFQNPLYLQQLSLGQILEPMHKEKQKQNFRNLMVQKNTKKSNYLMQIAEKYIQNISKKLNQ